MVDQLTPETKEEELISRLSALRDELDAIVTDLGGVEEEEEAEEEMPPDVEGEIEEEPPVPEAVEVSGRPEPLGDKSGALQSGQDVKGSKIKAKGDKARLPSGKKADGRPENLGNKPVPTWNKVSDGPMGSSGSELIK
mgnify:FL=1